LVLHGEEDLTVTLADAEGLIAANPAARLVTIENAGHVFEGKHPFESVPAQLDQAIALTVDHFRIAWELD
jgi:pimeloyl-ACP methyl ester carboxylesterase